MMLVYKSLRKIVCFVQSDIVYPSMGEFYDQALKTYLLNLKHVCTRQSVTIKPKSHFLVHYPTMVQLFGPCKRYSSIRFERVHKLSKDVMATSNNTVNIPYTLATRYLDKLNFSHFLPTTKYKVFATYEPNQIYNRVLLPYQQFLDSSREFGLVSICKINGIIFEPENYYAIKYGNSFQIAKCKYIYLQKYDQIEKIIILGDLMTVTDFDGLCFVLVESSQSVLIDPNELFTPRRLYYFRNHLFQAVQNDFYFECPENKFSFFPPHNK